MANQYAYLTATTGPLAGSHFHLDPTDETTIGRGIECEVVLTDPVASRVHAVVWRERDGWMVRDAESRNGTYLTDVKIDEARLTASTVLRIGTTQFTFHLSDQPPTSGGAVFGSQTVIRDSPITPNESGRHALAALQDQASVDDFLLLYQLSLKLLRCSEPIEAIASALDILQHRVGASVVGFLWASESGELVPKLVVPAGAADRVALSKTLTEVVLDQRRAVWIANQSGSREDKSLEMYADAFCIPLIEGEQVLGAIHVYLGEGSFRPADYEFGVSLCAVLTAALVSTRRQASLKADHDRLVASSATSGEMIGESKPMIQLQSKITRIARASGCVLIRGESGSGKELVARALHQASGRSQEPMLSVNCAAIPAELMESQLFGHKKGAFTSAESDHTGWFKQADSGTLFLDEVGEMTLAGQAKLLRVLEGHPFLPVGATDEVSVDVRVVAATNQNLQEFVREGRFREDLFYRLSVFELLVPPLRDRGSDIALLLNHFFDHFRQQHGRTDLTLSDDAREKLLGYNWPGNIRQLRNVIDSAVVMVEGKVIEPEDLGLRDTGGGELESLKIDFWERKLIKEALTRCENSVPEAAKMLGIGRATLYRKIEEYGIER